MEDPSLTDEFEFDVDDEGTIDEVAKPRQLDADTILDTLVPATVDWRGTVGRHPLISVLGVGVVGYLVGRTRGSVIMAGLSASISAAMMRQLGDVFEGDFFDF